jgi:hypothetical protein
MCIEKSVENRGAGKSKGEEWKGLNEPK